MLKELNTYNLKIPIIHQKIDLSKDQTNKYIEDSYKLSIEYNSKETNLTGHKSSYDLHLKTNKFNSLFSSIFKHIENEIPYQYFYPKEAFTFDEEPFIRLVDSWCSVYYKNTKARYHTHNPAHVSFCYYLQTDENSSPIIFDQIDVKIKPKSNYLIAFPGFLGHRVPLQKKHNLDRVIIAGNIRYIGKGV